MTRREYTIRDIHMALDGEMPAEDREGYENWLAANPDMTAASLRFATDRARLQSALDPVFKEPVPDRLANMLSDAPSAEGWRWFTSRISWKPAAAAALVLVSAAIGYYAGTSGERGFERGDEAVVERA